MRSRCISTTSKSATDFPATSPLAAQQSPKVIAYRCSPIRFTQHQRFAVLVLTHFLKGDDHGIVIRLRDFPTLANAIELEQIPPYTTLQKASERLLKTVSARILWEETVRRQWGRRSRIPVAAVDSTPLASRCRHRECRQPDSVKHLKPAIHAEQPLCLAFGLLRDQACSQCRISR